jgi:hypothetical protein
MEFFRIASKLRKNVLLIAGQHVYRQPRVIKARITMAHWELQGGDTDLLNNKSTTSLGDVIITGQVQWCARGNDMLSPFSSGY